MSLDQSQLVNNGTAYIPVTTTVWQSFTAGASGSLINVIVTLISPAGSMSGSAVFTLYSGQGTGGTVLYSATVGVTAGESPTPNGFAIPFVSVTEGSQYTYALSPVSPYAGYIANQYQACIGCTNPNASTPVTISGSTFDPSIWSTGVSYAAGDGTVRSSIDNSLLYRVQDRLWLVTGTPAVYSVNDGGTPAIYSGGVMGFNSGSDYQNGFFAMVFETYLE